MHLVDLASSIYLNDLLETTDTSIPRIVSWLCANIGTVNDYLGTSYTISGNDAIPELTEDVSAIFAVIYLDRYYARQVQLFSGASGYDSSWTEWSEGDSSIRRVSKNEIAKTMMQLKKENSLYLKDLISGWKRYQCIPANLLSNSLVSSICGCH